MTQLSIKASLKEWGYKYHTADKRDMKQLHLRNTFTPIHRHYLTYEERQMVLESHMFPKKKQHGNIKGQTVDGGKKSVRTFPRKMSVLQLSAHKIFYRHAPSTPNKIGTPH